MDTVRFLFLIISFVCGAFLGFFYGKCPWFSAFRLRHRFGPHLLPFPCALVGLLAYVILVHLNLTRAAAAVLYALMFVFGFSWGNRPAFTGCFREWFGKGKDAKK